MITFLTNRYRKGQTAVRHHFETGLIKRQQLLADAFQRGSKKLSKKSLYFFLAAFCICFGSAFIRIAITAIKNNHPVPFAVPRVVTKQGSDLQGKDSINVERQWEYIHNLKEYIEYIKKRDSIHQKKVTKNSP